LVCCAFTASWIVGSIFSVQTLNSEWYICGILDPVWTALQEEKRYGYFTQDGATAHTANYSINVSNKVFENRLIGHRLWPAGSPDLNHSDFLHVEKPMKQSVFFIYYH
jgi:hypothetical protein